MKALLNRRVPSIDGVELGTDVYLPDGPGPWPAVLLRTPYNRVGQAGRGHALAARGYAFVAQDVRGKFGSDGHFVPLEDEAPDGQATVDWIANQRWCNGRVGLVGMSYLGIVQAPTACGGHPALRCMVPGVAPCSFMRDWLRHDGCFALGNAVRWSLEHTTGRVRPTIEHITYPELWRQPSAEALFERIGLRIPALEKWLAHDVYDDYWRALDQDLMHEQIRIPALHVGGWFDHISRGQLRGYGTIRDRGATPLARRSQRLLVGPWGHNTVAGRGPAHTRYGDWEFGPEADLDYAATEQRYLDHYLKDDDTGLDDEAPVRLFVMGLNRWVDFADYPPPQAQEQTWRLDSSGVAQWPDQPGALSREAPSREAADSIRVDPANPVPVLGGPIYWGYAPVGPVDQRPVLERADVLYYRSAVLDRPLTVIGEPLLELYLASSAEDTDIIVKLCVELPNRAVIVLTNGSLRCRYRDSYETVAPLPRNEPVRLRVQLNHTAYRFPADARIGLIIAGHEFPRILPHHNTMEPTWAATPAVVANNRFCHGPATPACLKLPTVDL